MHKAYIAREALMWIRRRNDDCAGCLFNLLVSGSLIANSHPICQELGKHEHIALISSGGQLERQYDVNPSLISRLKSPDIDLFIFSYERIEGSGDLWYYNTINADFKSILLR